MKILIINKQRLIKINPLRIKRLLRKALKIIIYDKIASKNSGKNLSNLASRWNNIELSILFVNDKRIREINLKYRKKDAVTDVISFPQAENSKYFFDMKPEMPAALGDIVVNLHQAKRQSLKNKIRFYDELLRLLLHGLLHLLGYDHEKNKYQAKKMHDIEARLFALTTGLRRF